jgi:hypothetical protein
MFVAKKLTIVYHAAQDRLRMAVEDEKNRRLVLWLTARLTRKLIEHLLQNVVSTVSRNLSQAAGQRSSPTLSKGALQAWEQDLALRARQVSNAVAIEEATPQFLVESVNVRYNPQGLDLTFLCSGGQGSMRFSMSPTELRQWLDLVFRKTCQAGWPLDYWPEWIRRPVGSSQPEINKLSSDKMVLH